MCKRKSNYHSSSQVLRLAAFQSNEMCMCVCFCLVFRVPSHHVMLHSPVLPLPPTHILKSYSTKLFLRGSPLLRYFASPPPTFSSSCSSLSPFLPPLPSQPRPPSLSSTWLAHSSRLMAPALEDSIKNE